MWDPNQKLTAAWPREQYWLEPCSEEDEDKDEVAETTYVQLLKVADNLKFHNTWSPWGCAEPLGRPHNLWG